MSMSIDASIYLKGTDLQPTCITGILGVAPGHSHKRGDLASPSNEHSAKFEVGSWSLSVTSTTGELSDTVLCLFKKIDGTGEHDFLSMPGVDSAFIDIFVVSEVDQSEHLDRNIDFILDGAVVSRISRSRLPIHFSVCSVITK